MGTNDQLQIKPPLRPKPQIKVAIPQKVLDSPESESGTQYRPTPKPRLHKPGPLKHTQNPIDDADQMDTCYVDTAASSKGSRSYSDAPTCPPCCPCVCHYASKNEPETTELHEDNHIISSESKDNNSPRRVPPDIPLPARPKEPWQIIVMNVGERTDDEHEAVYAEPDLPEHEENTRNEPESNFFALKAPSQKSISTAKKWSKEKMAAQKQSKPQENVRNELCQKFSSKTKQKPNTVKKMLVKMISPEDQDDLKLQWSLFPVPNKTKQKLPVLDNSTPSVFDCSHSQSSQTSPKCPEKSCAAMLPSSDWIWSSSNKDGKKEGGHFQKIQQESLWQERCVVKESGILKKLNMEEIRLQEGIYEVATSELSFHERLTVVVNHFMDSSELNSAITPQDQKCLFSSMRKMRELSQNFLDSMIQNLGSGLFCDVLCDVVCDYTAGPFDAYVDYIRNMPCQKHTLINLRKENPCFVEILNKLQEDPCCNRLPLDSFLALPFQRISHLKVLLETVLKRTTSKSDVQASANAALTGISKVLEKCNREVGKMKQIEELVNITNKIEFECKALALVSSSRCLIRNGEMIQLALNENIFGQKKNCHVHLILFNDMLLLASKKGSDKYVVHDYVHRSLIAVTEGDKVEDDLEGHDVNRVFLLAILKNHIGIPFELLLQASTLEERDSWLEVLRNEEGVYEEWDCPQMRCTEAYNGQQPEELSLKPDDIVSIIQKTSNGLMEGQRLTDGERGWFPSKCVMEISNEHVQRRNLHQRHQVLQTAARILKHRSICQDLQTTSCFNKH